jgi:hypothetical protein
VPIAVETPGALGKNAADFFHEVGSRIAAVRKERRTAEFLMQRVSVAIQCDNAACITGTLPNSLSMDEVSFYFI